MIEPQLSLLNMSHTHISLKTPNLLNVTQHLKPHPHLNNTLQPLRLLQIKGGCCCLDKLNTEQFGLSASKH